RGRGRAVTARGRFGLGGSGDDPMAGRGLYAAAFWADGRVVATAGPDPVVRLDSQDYATGGSVVRCWDIESGRPFGTPLRFAEFVRDLAFLPDGNLGTACNGHTARACDPATRPPPRPPMPPRRQATPAALSPHGGAIST